MERAFMLFSLLATYLAFGGSALEAAGDPRAKQLTYEPWTKLCFDKSKCFVGTGAKGGCFPSGGAVSIATDEKNASLSVHLGTKRTPEGAISVQVDQGTPILIPHPECDGLACRGKFEIDSEFIERLRRSQTMTLEATIAHEKLSLSLSLTDFAKVYDGPAAPLPTVFEETTEKMKAELAKRAEEQKKLQCEE
jgi:invasion protein IalB